MKETLHFIKNERGATALEYGLLAALIAAAIVVSVTNLGAVVSDAFNFISSVMQTALV